MDNDGAAPATESKRRKKFSRSEVLQMLKEHESNVRQVAEEICEELVPFDVSDEDVVKLDDRLERMKKASLTMEKRIRHLQNHIKAKKFRHHPEQLEEDFVRSSQCSVFQSDDSQSIDQEPEGDNRIV